MDQDLILLHEKMDLLLEEMEQRSRRQKELLDLRSDLLPIANHLFKLTIDELAEIGQDFQLEDLLFLLKRLLRNTRSLVEAMDMFESGFGLLEEANLLGKEIFNEAVAALDRMEREGYFKTLAGLGYAADQAVQQVQPETIRALADRIGSLVAVLEKATKPATIEMAERALTAVEADHEYDKYPGFFTMVKIIFSRDFRLGLYRMLRVVEAFGVQPGSTLSEKEA